MPKTVISDAKGVVNSAGSGTTVSNAVTLSGAATLSNSVIFGVQAVAAAGTNQSTAAAISATGGYVAKVSGADNTKAVRLPSPTAGLKIVIINAAASTTLPVFPPSGAAINGGSPDASVTIAAKAFAICIGDGTDWWVTEPPAA